MFFHALILLLVSVCTIAAAGILYQALAGFYDARQFRAPGRLIDIGGCRLHLNEQGAGSPVVILESGIAASSLSWALVQERVAVFAHVCSYDRAGLGWSDPCRQPRTLDQIVGELESLLTQTGLSPPYVLVGHSFGGLVIRAFAHRHREKIAGLVFVDPVSLEFWANCAPDEKKRLDLAIKLSRRGALLARIAVVRAALAVLIAGGKRFPQLVTRATAGQGTRTVYRLVGEVQKLPHELWPAIRAHWSRPKSFAAMAAYLQCLTASARAALSMPIPEDVPVTVLSASSATRAEIEERDSWIERNRQGRHIRVGTGGHWLQLETPDMVSAAIEQMVRGARE